MKHPHQKGPHDNREGRFLDTDNPLLTFRLRSAMSWLEGVFEYAIIGKLLK